MTKPITYYGAATNPEHGGILSKCSLPSSPVSAAHKSGQASGATQREAQRDILLVNGCTKSADGMALYRALGGRL